MSNIPFTQYLRPDGRKRVVSIDLPDAVAQRAALIIEKGLVFECEELSTGQVSFTITDPREGDLDIRICMNGPDVPETVEKLIMEFKL